MSEFQPILLFVYGTLMQGLGNHGIISKYSGGSQRFLGKARTIEKYLMLTSGVPFVNSKIPEVTIKGELFEISDKKLLDELDRLEGHPDWYVRTLIKVQHIVDVAEDNGPTVDAFIYFNDQFTEEIAREWGSICKRISSGNFMDAN